MTTNQQKIQAAKEKFLQVNAIFPEATSALSKHVTQFRSKSSTINKNPELSQEGKQNRMNVLRAESERDAIKFSAEFFKRKSEIVQSMRKEANEVLVADVPETEKHTRALFDRKAESHVARAMFAPTPIEAQKALLELVNAATEPGLAEGIKTTFTELATKVIERFPASEQAAVRVNFAKMYEQLEVTARPDALQAQELLDNADRLERENIANPLVVNALSEISRTTFNYINRPEEYLAKK